MGSAWGKGVKEGPVPQDAGKISSQCSARAGTTYGQGQGGPDELDVMKKDRHEQSERFSEQDRRNYVIMIADMILILCFFFRRINHMALKTICIDPLSTCCCTSRREQ
jgi:hypothetical protein